MATREQTFSSPDTYESAYNRVLTRAYALNWEMIAYGVIIVLALVTRLVDLGVRVMSHDESLHTYYSWRLYEFGEFQHTPLMHGPLLFHMTALSYFLFGDNDFTARLYPALLGVAIVAFPYFFRRWLGRVGAVIASVLLLISPMLMYYSRYIRHDIPTIFFALLMLYAILQYVDGVRQRRPVWLLVLSVGLVGMLASKEVAFIYIALFGSFMVLYWVLRMFQDVGIRRRPSRDPGWQAPWLQRVVGHVVLLGVVGLLAFELGILVRQFLLPVVWLPDALPVQAALFAVIYVPLALSGVVRRLMGQSGGVAGAIMAGFRQGRSAFYLLMAGIILGAVLALVTIVVLDVIKPTSVWTTTTTLSTTDQSMGINATKEYAYGTGFDDALFVRMLTWIGLPVLVLGFVIFLGAVLRFPGRVPLPWREILLVLLVAFVAASILVAFERRSYVVESAEQPFAADPTAESAAVDGKYDRLPIIVTWVIGTIVVLGVVGTRFLTNWWDFLNRQPIFDILIVIGTLILPWLAAFPLYWAGYNLEEYNPGSVEGRDTLNAAVITFIPFALASIAVGLAWNWKRWLPVGAVFIGIFAFFFTTVFSNQYGLATGMIGSLGYWLEQQGVRRGSQPQYYYLLTQLPVYEFLPMILASLAALGGVSRLWGWRRARSEAALEAREAEVALEAGDAPEPAPNELEATGAPVEVREEAILIADDPPDADDPDEPPEPARVVSVVRYTGVVQRLFRPYNPDEEAERRASDPEWLGPLPFLLLVGYWAIMMVLGLTIAGEKMPWLTTHMTVPLALIGSWWLGTIIQRLNWQMMRDGGWLVMLVALPLAFIAAVRVFLPLWGEGSPLQGRTEEQLATTGTWLSALLLFAVAVYLVGRLGRRIGWAGLGRLTVVSGALLLGILTARAAVLASFVNYDYATEFLVYAHSGPAVKTVMEEVDRIAELTNEGENMRVVFDDQSSWPFTWYFRDYPNYGFLRGEAGSVDSASLDNARVVVVGQKKAGDVRTILGDRFYEFSYIRLWWPMQEYFYLTYDRVANLFSTDDENIAAERFREALWAIWLRRDYTPYAEAMCMEQQQTRCDTEASYGETEAEQAQLRATCLAAVTSECRDNDRFDVSKWPVSDRMYFFVDKEIAARVWDAGIGSTSVDVREPQYGEDLVYRDIFSEAVIGAETGMSNPRGVAVGPDGSIYVADTDRNRVLVLAPSGDVLRTIGEQPGGTSDPGSLLQPWDVAVAPDGTVYVADTWNHRIQVFSADGEWLRQWGHEGIPANDPSTDALWGPRAIALGLDGQVYVADTGNKRVRVYTPEGEWLRDIGSPGSALGQLDEPVGLAVNPVSGDLYVAEAWNQRIQVFTADGVPVHMWNVNMWFRNRESFNRPYLAVSPDGTLIYATDMDTRRRVVAYDVNGQPVAAFNQIENAEANLIPMRSPAGIAVGANGRVHVVDAQQGLVYIFPPIGAGNVPPQGADGTGAGGAGDVETSPDVVQPTGDTEDTGIETGLGETLDDGLTDSEAGGAAQDAGGANDEAGDAPGAIDPTPTG